MTTIRSSAAESNYYLFKTDHNGHVVFVDPALLSQVAKLESEVKGKHCNELLPLSNASFEYENIFEAVNTNQIWEGEVSNTHNNQSNAFQMAVTTSYEEDDSYGYIFILTPKENGSSEIAKSYSDVSSSRGLFGNRTSLVAPASYKTGLTLAIFATVVLAMNGVTMAQTIALIGMLLVVVVPTVATGLVLDKWLLKPEKQLAT